MINAEVIGYPVLVNRDFTYCGLHKKGDIIKYNFSPAHRKLKESGAISDFEENLYEYKYINGNSYTINGKKYKIGDIVDIAGLSDREIEVFIKQKIISKDLKEKQDYTPRFSLSANNQNTDIIQTDVSDVKNDIMGLTFKQLCDEYQLDVESFCEKLNIKKNGLHLRKVTEKNIDDVLLAL